MNPSLEKLLGLIVLTVALATACSSTKLTDAADHPNAGGDRPDLGTGHPTTGPVGTTGPTGATGSTGSPAIFPTRAPAAVGPRYPVPTETYRVQLAGDHVSGATAALVGVASLRAWADGVEIDAKLDRARVDLSVEGNAWPIGTVAVPVGTKAVRFRLELDDGGGYVPADPSKAGGVEIRDVPIEWTSQVDWLASRGHTVVHLDVGRSFARAHDGWIFLPQLTVLH